ncbi:hypothetical protein GCM10022419_099380 [Nonomuraea rosea]|uniref:Uncharacterized protein n=1 Tax=Nonomuraea rosea TaxID=638574 RepID=A0ABP6Z9U2_9ACTN
MDLTHDGQHGPEASAVPAAAQPRRQGMWSPYNTFKGGFADGMSKLAGPFR